MARAYDSPPLLRYVRLDRRGRRSQESALGSSPLRLVVLGLLALPRVAGAAGLDVDDPTPRTARLKRLPGGPVFEGAFAVSGGSGVLTFPNSESKRFLEAIHRGNATSVTAPLEVRVDLTTRATRVSIAGSLESDPGETFQFLDEISRDAKSDALAGSTGPEYCSSVEEFIAECAPGGFFGSRRGECGLVRISSIPMLRTRFAKQEP